MFLELAKFASLLLSILLLDAVFHTAFLEPGSHLEEQLLPALRMLLLAAAASLGSGYLFRAGERREQRVVRHDGSVAGSLPMMIFWWGTGVMGLLFFLAWLIERYHRLWR